uniref:Uncharacterized protein n=1 Tax=Caenorhabditis japonica TaxID=281687 RepID=A0A8R1I237_CAEJA
MKNDASKVTRALYRFDEVEHYYESKIHEQNSATKVKLLEGRAAPFRATVASRGNDVYYLHLVSPRRFRSEIEILVADQNLAPLDRKIKRVAAKEPKDYADVKARVKKGAVATKTSAKKDVKSTASKTKRIKESARKEVKKKN